MIRFDKVFKKYSAEMDVLQNITLEMSRTVYTAMRTPRMIATLVRNSVSGSGMLALTVLQKEARSGAYGGARGAGGVAGG